MSEYKQVEINLPPLQEQKRIVAEIEKQFSRLDEAVAALERVKANLKRYRASVLKAACEGRLVPTEAELARNEGREYETGDKLLQRILQERRARWEETELEKMRAKGKEPKNDAWKKKYKEPVAPDTSGLPELPEGWVWASVEQISKSVEYGSSQKTSDDGEVPVLRMGNLGFGWIDTTNLKYLAADHREFPRLLLTERDLLFNRTNSAELVGKCAVYRGKPVHASFASYLIRVRFHPEVDPEFVGAYINSIHGRKWVRSVVSQQVGQANVNGTKLKNLSVPMPPVEEQKRITAELDRLLTLIDSCAAQVTDIGKKTANQRAAVLGNAFSGKLVPQDPDDEPAEKLLERIRAEREVAPKTKRRNRTKKPQLLDVSE